MKKNVKEILEELDYDNLIKLKYDLDNGAVHLKRILNRKIQEIEKKNMHVCANCGRKINPMKDFEIVVTYGTPDFKRRAHLCSVDCLLDFSKELKAIESKARKVKDESV